LLDSRGATARLLDLSLTKCGLIPGVHYVEYAGWQAIDAAERAAGEPRGRPRVKLVAWEQLLRTGRPL